MYPQRSWRVFRYPVHHSSVDAHSYPPFHFHCRCRCHGQCQHIRTPVLYPRVAGPPSPALRPGDTAPGLAPIAPVALVGSIALQHMVRHLLHLWDSPPVSASSPLHLGASRQPRPRYPAHLPFRVPARRHRVSGPVLRPRALGPLRCTAGGSGSVPSARVARIVTICAVGPVFAPTVQGVLCLRPQYIDAATALGLP